MKKDQKPKLKRYSVDVFMLAKLSQKLVQVWAEEAGNYNNLYIFNFLKIAIYFSH
jgi:hypothetical protein